MSTQQPSYRRFADQFTNTTTCHDCGMVLEYLGYAPSRCEKCERHWRALQDDQR